MQQKIQRRSLFELFRLIQFHISDSYEIYTYAQMRNFYQRLKTAEENSTKLRNIDLKNKLRKNSDEDLKFLKPTYFYLTSASEFVLPSDHSLLPKCLSTVLLGGGIQQSLLIKSSPKAVSEEIQDRLSSQEHQWPPTPQKIIQSYCIDC